MRYLFCLFCVCLIATDSVRAADAVALGRIERHRVKGASLEGGRLGDFSEAEVIVYLPPSYDSESSRRYPTLYLLHGIGDDSDQWVANRLPYLSLPDLMNRGVAAGRLREFIVVMPDAHTRYLSSFYVNSAVNGNWDDFISRDLVAWTDKAFRTIADSRSRGIAGHSMGGYGALTHAMKHPDVFSVVYALNPGVLDWGEDLSAANPAFRKVLEIRTTEELQSASRKDFYVLAITCMAAAFSPNPDKPPLFVDYPFKLEADQLVPDEPAHSKWEEHFPVRLVVRYADNLRKLRGIRFDSAFTDTFTHIPPTCRALSDALTGAKIEHTFEMYNGDHWSRLPGRQGRFNMEVLPYFSELLEFAPPGAAK